MNEYVGNLAVLNWFSVWPQQDRKAWSGYCTDMSV